MKMHLTTLVGLLLVVQAWAQDVASVSNKLDSALAELAQVRGRIGQDSVALTETLNGLRAERNTAKDSFESVKRTLDRRSLDINNLKEQIKNRTKAKDYLSTLMDDYLRNWDSRLHVVEVNRYRDLIDDARNAPGNKNLTTQMQFEEQLEAVDESIARLERLIGGEKYKGTSVGAGDGKVRIGHFIFLGPIATFASEEDGLVGESIQDPNQSLPVMLPYDEDHSNLAAREAILKGAGEVPFDPSLGNARKMAETEEELLEHMAKGGLVMFPLMGMFGIAMLIALYKTIAFTLLPKPSKASVQQVFDHLREGELEQAQEVTRHMKGNMGVMLREGTAHLRDHKDLIEEVMFEKMLETRHLLNRALPFIAVCAASAPLLGLLGTVTGIISTFKLLTVFGSGDVGALSSGISVALITTEYGLIVAIPSLLSHAALSRVAKSNLDRMEQAAILFMSALEKARADGKAPPPKGRSDAPKEPEPRKDPESPEEIKIPDSDDSTDGDVPPLDEAAPA